LMCGCLIVLFMNHKGAVEIGVVNCTLEVSWIGIIFKERDQLFYLHWWFKCQVLMWFCANGFSTPNGGASIDGICSSINLCFRGHENFHH
jgi:hypothetical protein